MPRIIRVAMPNHPHHVVQRGHNRARVFATDSDRLAYLATLEEFREVLEIKVYGYCLMPNHVHLILNPGADPTRIGRLMKRLAGRHTRRINRLESRSGTAWEGRYKCSLIDTDRYLLACSRYVDLNPVRAGIVKRPDLYRWSSYRALAGIDSCDWLDPSPSYLALADSTAERRRRYVDFVTRGSDESELGVIRSALSRNQLTGDVDFVRQVEARTNQRISTRGPGRPRSENRSDPI